MTIFGKIFSISAPLLLLFFITLSYPFKTDPSQASYQPEVEKNSFAWRLSMAALERTKQNVRYDGKYVSIPYPMGDVPKGIGVCTDVVIRSYRALKIDLQERVHKDMKRHFSVYPKRWGLKRPDTNIDHRRVPNLRVFLKRFGKSLAPSDNPQNYQPGDLVTWYVGNNLPHIGIVTHQTNSEGTRPLIVHNIGRGPEKEDMLFDYKITGHYRYHPSN